MKKQKNFTHALVFLSFFSQYMSAEISITRRNDEQSYINGYVLVKTIADYRQDELDDVVAAIGGQIKRTYSLVPGLVLYKYNDSLDIADVLHLLSTNDNIEYAEPDYLYHAAAQLDPNFPEQWALENSGQNGGSIDADINALTMWDLTQGEQNVVVGVIDTGIDYNHSDLKANLWRNLIDVPANGIDEDQNGYVDDFYGINTITNNGNPFDDNAHGTHVSGTIAAQGNNNLGVVGVAPNVRIAACKFLNANGSGATSDAIECLQYFAKLKTRAVNPVNIIATNNSWSGSSKSSALTDAIKAHQNLGILFVAAASNDALNNDLVGTYPANIPLANVISVAATDNKDNLASFSNYGKYSVHSAAPGVRILSTVPNQSYALFSGTSMATPHVAGLAAIITSRFPNLDYKGIKNLIMSSGVPLSSLNNKIISGRRIRGADTNGRGALTCVNQTILSRISPQASTISTMTGKAVLLQAVNINCNAPAGNITLYSDSLQTITLQDNGINGDETANDGVYSLLWLPQIAGTFSLNFGNGDVITASVFSSLAAPLYQASSISYAYETITGTSLLSDDESVHKVVSPFPIKWKANATGFQTLYVSSNGTISFSDNLNPGYLNTALPTNAVQSLIAPYWDDLAPASGTSDIYVGTIGTAPNRKFVVEWRNMRQLNSSGAGTFQAVFYEGSPNIRFNYQDTNFSNVNYNSGKSATVGIQSSGNNVSPYSFNSAVILSNSSILFSL